MSFVPGSFARCLDNGHYGLQKDKVYRVISYQPETETKLDKAVVAVVNDVGRIGYYFTERFAPMDPIDVLVEEVTS